VRNREHLGGHGVPTEENSIFGTIRMSLFCVAELSLYATSASFPNLPFLTYPLLLHFIVEQEKDHHILLQNENGPCPLLAATNCLILKGAVELPSNCIGVGVVTIDQLVNVLAEKILMNNSSEQGEHHVQEVLTIFPTLQFGMDVNPKFTAGPTAVEYTMHLNAFDLLHVELVHGWLLEPDAEEYQLIENKTYNQLVNLVIEGNDAASTLQNATPTEGPISAAHDVLSTKATQGAIVNHFLVRSGHQLTQYGLDVLYEYMKDGQMVVFFRNNHFNTLTKHAGILYLLVTDFGYANVSTVVWEKLDVIDGDTEYVNGQFATSLPIVNQNGGATLDDCQSQADYQLALQLNQENSQAPATRVVSGAPLPTRMSQEAPYDAEMEAAQRASIEEYNRLNPHNPIVGTPQPGNKGTESTSLFDKQMTLLTERMRQAGTTIGISLQDAASSAANIIQPTGFRSPSTAGTPESTRLPTQTVPAAPIAPRAQSPHLYPPNTVAIGVPSKKSLQEHQDAILVMQLRRHDRDQLTQPIADPWVPPSRRPTIVNQPTLIANGVPSDKSSQEHQDAILAMQLQRHERDQQTLPMSEPWVPPSLRPIIVNQPTKGVPSERSSQEHQDAILAMQLQRQERDQQTHPVSEPWVPPSLRSTIVNQPTMIAKGVPSEKSSQERQDAILAMQLQRHERDQQTYPITDPWVPPSLRSTTANQRTSFTKGVPSEKISQEYQDAILAMQLQRLERDQQTQPVSDPSVSPLRHPTVPGQRQQSAKKENCIIS
jgi:MINDY deubiquitinase